MSQLKLDKFGGMIPMWADTLVPPNQASLCRDAYLYSGALLGWRRPTLLHTLSDPTALAAFRVPTQTSGTAGAYLIFGTNPNEGDTVKIGEETYRFTATVTAAYDVLLGATTTDTASHLEAALTIGTGQGTLYGNGTCANPAIDTAEVTLDVHDFGSGDLDYVHVQASDFGEAFNVTAVTESTAHARLRWLSSLSSFTSFTTTFTGGLNLTADTAIDGTSHWMEFADRETDVMKSQVVDDRFQRYYFACPSLPPKYNTYDRIVADQPAWLLGVPVPGCAPGVTATGGGNSATIGLPDAVAAAPITLTKDKLYLIPVTIDGAMQLDSISVTPGADNAAVSIRGVLYSDASGAPGSLINVGETTTGALQDTEMSSAFQTPSGLSTGLSYWIGVQIGGDDLSATYGGSSLTQHEYTALFDDGAPLAPAGGSTSTINPQLWGSVTTDSVLAARAYVYTWVTEYGEEGPPSPPTSVIAWSNGTWTINTYTPPPDDMGVVRNVTKTRLYRTVSGVGGSTTFFFVAEFPVAQVAYVDTVLDDVVSLRDQLQSTLWFPPPENLQGIMAMPNGMAVGFKGNELWFCEPYRPHAWPSSYVLTTEFPIVGIGVCGQSVVACTESNPATATGVNPGAMALNKIKFPAPCISRGSILSSLQDVVYASPQGLIRVDQNGQASNMTESWISRERWPELTPQTEIHAIRLASDYFAFQVDTQTGYSVELASDQTSFEWRSQVGGHRIGFETLTAPGAVNITNLMTDPWTGYGLTIQGGAVYYYNFTDQSPTLMPYLWRSRQFQDNALQNYSALRVYFTVPPSTPTQNPVRNTAQVQTLQTDQYGLLRFYADDVLVKTQEIRRSGELMRLPSGFKYDFLMIEVEARVKISNIQFATSVAELRQV
jgi:hypothetical protein